MNSARYLKVDTRVLKLTHLDKIFYPSARFRKRDVIRYYQSVGPTVLPHLKNRPFTLRRFPSGVEGPSFYEKQCPHSRPDWVPTGLFGATRHCLINDIPTLLWVANLAAIELHTTLAALPRIECPNFIVFDLDPGEGTGIRECAEVALLIREWLDKHDLKGYPKTSGMKGLHVYVPVNLPIDYFHTKHFARSLAEELQFLHPDRVTAKMPKSFREAKIFIDWSQNTDFKTTTSVYSLGSNEIPTASTPLDWREIREAVARESAARRILSFETKDVLTRILKKGDLFKPVLSLKQRIPRQPQHKQVA